MLRGQQQGLAPRLRGMDLLGSRPKGKGTLAAAPCGGSYAWHTFLMFFRRSWGRWKLFVHSSCCESSTAMHVIVWTAIFLEEIVESPIGAIGHENAHIVLVRYLKHNTSTKQESKNKHSRT